MSKQLEQALKDAESDAEAAIRHRDHIKGDLARAQEWVTKSLQRETQARFELRVALLAESERTK